MKQEEIYDPTDDLFDDEVIDPAHCLMTNEEIFTDEYMRDFAEKMDAKIAREKRNDRLVSVCVIVSVVAYIVALTAFFFRNI